VSVLLKISDTISRSVDWVLASTMLTLSDKETPSILGMVVKEKFETQEKAFISSTNEVR